MGRARELGSAFIRLFVDKSALKTGLNEAKADVTQAAEQMNTAGQKAAGGFSGIATGIKSATKPARDLLGAVTSALGIFTRILGVVGLIGAGVAGIASAFRSVATYAERTAKALDDQIQKQKELGASISTSGKDAADIRKQIVETEERITQATEERDAILRRTEGQTAEGGRALKNVLKDIERRKELEKEIAALTTGLGKSRAAADQIELESTLKRLTAERYAAEKKAQEDAVAEREKAIDAARDAAAAEIDLINEEAKVFEDAQNIKARAFLRFVAEQEKAHARNLDNIEKEKAAQLRAIAQVRAQQVSAANAIAGALGQNNLSVAIGQLTAAASLLAENAGALGDNGYSL